MNNPTINPQKIIPPDLNSWWLNRKNEIKSEINCVAIGTVQDFNTTNQTASVLINYVRVVTYGQASPTPSSNDMNDATSDLVQSRTYPYPKLVQVPVMISSGGGGYLTFPVAQGDTCIVLFNDRDIDTWWSTGATGAPPNSPRLHDLSDGIAIIGIRNVINAITSYNMNGPELYGATGISIKSQVTTLRIALDALFSALLAWVDTDGDTPNPATIAAITAAKALVDAVLI